MPQIGFYTTKTVRLQLTELPSILRYVRNSRIKLPIDVICDVSKTIAKTEDQRDGIEEFTVTTDFSGTIRIIDIDTTLMISADRRSMGPIMRMHCHSRRDGQLPTPKYNIRFDVNNLSCKYLGYDNVKKPGRPLDEFDKRVLASLQTHSEFILDPARGGWTKVPVDLRGLQMDWVPSALRDAPPVNLRA